MRKADGPPPQTANQKLLDSLVRHQIFLLRHAGWWVKKAERILSRDEAELEKSILDFKIAWAKKKISKPKIALLLGKVGKIRKASWLKIAKAWQTYGTDLMAAETQHMGRILKGSLPVVFNPKFPDKAQIRAAAVSRPFQGRVLRNWVKKLAVNDVRRVRASVARSFVEGTTIEELAREIQDILGGVQRREARAVARTAVSHISNRAKEDMAKANSDIIIKDRFVSTLDSRTTLPCAANDGQIFPIGKGPKPPLHFQCRSLRVPVINPKRYGTRPMKTASEREILQQFAKKHGIKGKLTKKTIPYGFKGKFRAFAKEAMDRQTGTVAASETYETFLRRQSESFQIEVLGAKRAKLFRTGKISLSQFVSREGDAVIPLDELYKKEKSLFSEANI